MRSPGRPDVTKFTAGGFLVAFGTGRYITTGDNTDLTTQRIYAVRDTGTPGTVSLALLLQQTILRNERHRRRRQHVPLQHACGRPAQGLLGVGDNTIVKSTYLSDKRGWYLDLPDSGERVVADARFRGGRAIFTSLVPDVTSPCAYGGSGWVLEFDAMTGNRFDSATFESNGDNVLTAADYISRSGLASQAMNTSGRRIGAIPAAPGFMSTGRAASAASRTSSSTPRTAPSSGFARPPAQAAKAASCGTRCVDHGSALLPPRAARRLPWPRRRALCRWRRSRARAASAVLRRPPASSVQAAAQQSAQAQADESASLRHGTIRAIDDRVTRVQVHGIWLDLVADKTQLLRNGPPRRLPRRSGRARRSASPSCRETTAPAMKVIYVP